MNKITANAYAKLNLSLDITGLRDDGYHLLKTVMQSISLHDVLEFEKVDEKGIFITCDKEGIPVDESNTVYKAAKKLFDSSDKEIAGGVKINIKKNIPSAAGLGGGSADAAAAFIALNKLYDLGYKRKELIKLSERVGADVPFCLCGGTALCEGIGEKITPLIPLINFHAVLLKSSAQSPTETAYKRFDSMHIHTVFRHDKILDSIAQGHIRKLGRNMFNVLEFITPRDVIDDAKNALMQNDSLGAMMTGSGSCVFGLYKRKSVAEKAYKELKDKFEFAALVEPEPYGVKIVD